MSHPAAISPFAAAPPAAAPAAPPAAPSAAPAAAPPAAATASPAAAPPASPPAAPRNEQGQTLQEFLAAYNPDRYRHPSHTVDMAVMTVANGKLKLLLIRRRNHPFLGCWATPGGFVALGEDLDRAALRELKEETGLDQGIYFRQLYTLGKADRDPRTHVITTAYITLAPAQALLQARAGDDAADAAWFTVSTRVLREDDRSRVTELTLARDAPAPAPAAIVYTITETVVDNWKRVRSAPDAARSTACLAGDHIKIVNMAVSLVREHALTTGLIFNMLPPAFLLSELQHAFEGVTGKTVNKPNFRRDVVAKKLVVPTGDTRFYYGRPVPLYAANRLYRYTDF